MILAALTFVFGAWVVQQMAQLPSLPWLFFIFFVACIISIPQIHRRFPKFFYTPKLAHYFLLSVSAFLFGVCWASSFALWRIGDELPHTWEQKTIVIEGVVASVPEATEHGERFRFDVEKILTHGAIVPKHISLNQYRANQYSSNQSSDDTATQLNQFHAGERWLLSVRLKRPHGTANPHGFDFESWALSENIRATGSIKSKAGVKKLDNFVWRPSYVIE
jgi:competence protein ComEC